MFPNPMSPTFRGEAMSFPFLFREHPCAGAAICVALRRGELSCFVPAGKSSLAGREKSRAGMPLPPQYIGVGVGIGIGIVGRVGSRKRFLSTKRTKDTNGDWAELVVRQRQIVRLVSTGKPTSKTGLERTFVLPCRYSESYPAVEVFRKAETLRLEIPGELYVS